ncbi:hypothetical protein [Streptomyces millisiae]|uniref:Uncharacterized protein n=1 Tax=Streptomyces millisiae TaxID=3075542 RepID=A0ABU2LNY4_9ACTN|nr:hypothetical protein [Streptomyces sp. DSM 44918]MDT0319305.1 hypothetical protein [Streptomyces sp. DSM 44918]
MTRIPRWPPPPAIVRLALQPDANTPPDEAAPNPWDLSALTGDLETAVWTWLDQVALWLNTTYGHTDDHVIPGCWPHHPAIAHELAAIAFTRIDVYTASTAAYIPRWHADLDDFYRRVSTSLGPNSSCLRGKHDELPDQYTADAANLVIGRRSIPSRGGRL